MKKKKIIISVLIAVFLAIFAFSTFQAITAYDEVQEAQQGFDVLQALAENENKSEENKWNELYHLNNDFVAWLNVPNTNISYPVMQSEAAPEYYLRRDFNGNASVSGTPFIGAECDIYSSCFIIYGHNMRANTMFGTLDKYKSSGFYQENKEFTLETANGVRVYRVFAVVKTSVTETDGSGKIYSDYVGSLSEENYGKLISFLTEHSLYETGELPQNKEQILMLSTCSYHSDNGRFVVAAYRVE